ncbi:MAG TPA: adenylyl-sulfate kinase [Acidimicrobiales bacterium]|nr:adenylyl-sulfate kinase [Acidimicrobiales bacterium]
MEHLGHHPDVVWSPGALGRQQRWDTLGISGATIWLTGLSGSGKSTLATAVEEHLIAHHRPAYRLDGDNVRHGLNSDLGFDRADRDENVRRVAEVAKLFAESGVVAVVALISPYAAGRRRARHLHQAAGLGFIEVYVDTPLAVCATRDPKGLYARAQTGALAALTGVDDPYEVPASPELVLAGDSPLDESVSRILEYLDSGERSPAPS